MFICNKLFLLIFGVLLTRLLNSGRALIGRTGSILVKNWIFFLVMVSVTDIYPLFPVS